MPEAFSPEWWLERLGKQLDEQAHRVARFDRYYKGKHDLRFASERFASTFGDMFLHAADNWMPLVVSSTQERLRIEGFRLGNNTAGDRRAWRIWQANNLDADSAVLFREALINGVAYTLTWFNETDETTPLITIEHPSEAIVACSPENRRRRLAGLKRWRDDEGYLLATLYLPDGLYKFRSRTPHRGVMATIQWVERELPTEPWPLPNPLGVVPLVPIANQQRMLEPGESELVDLIPTQDKINKLSFDMMVAAEYAAFRQRWATGLDFPVDPDTGQPIVTFKHAVDRLWYSTDPETKFGDFEATDLSNYVKAIEREVQSLASRSKTPPHYMLGQSGVFPSGESLKATETGLIRKVQARQLAYGEGWEETMRLALLAAGLRPRGIAEMETQWGDPESHTESEHVDSTMKKLALGVPLRQLWSDLGYSEEQAVRFAEMLREEAKLQETLRRAGRGAGSAGTSPSEAGWI